MSNEKCKEDARNAFKNYVRVNQTLVKHFKDSNPALILAYLIAEDEYYEAKKQRDQFGFFYCKVDKLEDKFGFSAKKQDPILKKLLDEELIKIVNKKIDGSSSNSKVRHIQIQYKNIDRIIKNAPKPEKSQYGPEYPPELAIIEKTLMECAKARGGNYVKTANDVIILRIASFAGASSEIIKETFNKKHRRIKGKPVTAKYLLTAFIPNIEELERVALEKRKRTKLKLNLY